MKFSSILFFTAIMFSACAQTSKKQVKALDHVAASELNKYSVATFAAGCFWHEEALFEGVKGVKEVVSGYAGGKTSNPTYEQVETATTGHAETVNVYYDKTQISYPTLLKIFFAGQDPTQANGQGNDLGPQYRSIAFYRNDAEKKMITDYMGQLKASGKYNQPLAVQVMPFSKFWIAEGYHQDYIEHNPNNGYVSHVSIPEIKEVQKEYPELMKQDHLF